MQVLRIPIYMNFQFWNSIEQHFIYKGKKRKKKQNKNDCAASMQDFSLDQWRFISLERIISSYLPNSYYNFFFYIKINFEVPPQYSATIIFFVFDFSGRSGMFFKIWMEYLRKIFKFWLIYWTYTIPIWCPSNSFLKDTYW